MREIFINLIKEQTGSYSAPHCHALFGVSVDIICYLFLFLPASFQPIYLLWALFFLKVYPVAEVGAATWKISERTFRDRVWQVIIELDKNLDEITLEDRFYSPELGPAYLAVDSKLCPVQVHKFSWDEQKLWYDGYHRKHGIKYEIGVHIHTGIIHWVQGGVFGNVADLMLLRTGGLHNFLLPGECIYCDKGYVTLHTGEHRWILCPFKGRSVNLTVQQIVWNMHINKHRVIVENALGRIWKFQCLQQPWRHQLSLHPVVFNVCAQIANIDMHERPLRADYVEDPELHALDPDDVHD